MMNMPNAVVDRNMPDVIIDRIPFRSEKQPATPLMVLVECNGVRHVAKQDATGKWRTLSRHKELRGPVEVVKVLR